jgi:hypothetical protein
METMTGAAFTAFCVNRAAQLAFPGHSTTVRSIPCFLRPVLVDPALKPEGEVTPPSNHFKTSPQG